MHVKFLRKLFGAPKTPDSPPVAPSSPAREAAEQAARLATGECLDRHWQSVGTVEQDVISYLISPSLTGGTQWPSTRQAYRVVRRDGAVLLASDGLSDPFDDVEGAGNGFEMEVFLETSDIPEQARGALGEVDPLKHSWAFEVLKHVADTVADAGGITQQLAQHGVLSLELPGVSQSHHIGEQVPASFVTEDDAVGVLLGGPAADFPSRLEGMPLSPVQLVPVVLITASELEYVRAGGRAAREQLVARLGAAGVGHRSSLQRDSVV